MSKKNILITGGGGLVGRALKKVIEYNNNIYGDLLKYDLVYHDELLYNYIYLTSKDGDLTKEENVKRIFELHKPDIVVHLAANVGGLYKNMYKRAEMFEDNILMNTYILKYSRIFKVKKIINILSTCIFPDNIQITEDNLHDGPPHPSNEGYAYAKRMVDIHSRILLEKNDIKYINLVPTNLYGFYDNFNLEDSHVIPALIHKCYLAKSSGNKFIVAGNGSPRRQFLYSYDFGRMIYKCIIDDNITPGNYICSPPKNTEISIGEVAKLIAENMNYDTELQFDTSLSNGQDKKTVSPSKIFEKMDFTDIKSGLQDTVFWFIDNYENIRK